MKLSEAIKLGAMTKPQGFGANTKPEVACALGAASDSLGFDRYQLSANYWQLGEVYPFLWQKTACPACRDNMMMDTMSQVYHLNDSHRWTREQIADWVSTIEPKGEPHDSSLDAPAVAAGVTTGTD